MTCKQCDDTGDVHSPTGEYRGRCSCPAGEWSKSDKAWAEQAAAAQAEQFARDAADDKAMRKVHASTGDPREDEWDEVMYYHPLA